MEAKAEVLFEYLTGTTTGSSQELEALACDVNTQALLQEVCRIVRAMPYAGELQAAPPDVKSCILAAITDESHRTEVEKTLPQAAPPAAALYILRAEEGDWIDPGLKGVSYKNLFVDHATGYATLLVRMQPDSWFPSHRHGGYEECYVISGDVCSGELELQTGDYQRMTGGSLHQALYTKNGCLFLIVGSEETEILAA
ncbi:MAG: cupin domain-containing protein [candidate division KSB1 bacterium]